MKYVIIASMILAGSLTSCSSDEPASNNGLQDMATGQDLNNQADAAPDLKNSPDASTTVEYALVEQLPLSTELGSKRGYRVARSIIHAHSVHSHDACDGDPHPDGQPNEPCNQDLRDGICHSRQDAVFLTDHEELAAEVDFETLLLQRTGDELLMEDGSATANRLRCSEGTHRPIILPGGEFGVMPIGLKRHLAGTIQERDAAYNQITPEVVNQLREAGAVVLQAHTESRDIDQLRALQLDGFEIYNLHANIAPDIREEWLGLPATGWVNDALPFFRGNGPPSLAFLAFFTENAPALAKYDTLLAEGQHLTGMAGTDTHQNVNLKLNDGIRVDSYGRMMSWFSNHLLVDEVTPAKLRDAVAKSRMYIAFEAIASPVGFDFYADQNGTVSEMGETAALGAELVVAQPKVHGFEGDVPIKIRLLKAENGGAVEVATSMESLSFTPTEAGVYRVEVLITPVFLRTILGDAAAQADREYVWIYSNPIYVQ